MSGFFLIMTNYRVVLHTFVHCFADSWWLGKFFLSLSILRYIDEYLRRMVCFFPIVKVVILKGN